MPRKSFDPSRGARKSPRAVGEKAVYRWVSENKFGPHRVVCRTPLTNIRITTFFAGEHEVRVLDPSRVELLDAIGCEVAVEG